MKDQNETIVAAVSIAAASDQPVIVSCEENPVAIKIRDALLAEAKLGGADLQIGLHENYAIISGIVLDEEQRSLALNITGRYVGRDRVVDQIDDDEDPGWAFCDG